MRVLDTSRAIGVACFSRLRRRRKFAHPRGITLFRHREVCDRSFRDRLRLEAHQIEVFLKREQGLERLRNVSNAVASFASAEENGEFILDMMSIQKYVHEQRAGVVEVEKQRD